MGSPFRLLSLLLFAASLDGCANYETVERPPAQEVIDRQAETLSAWDQGTDTAETERIIHWDKYWDYQALEWDGAWRVVEVTNPETDGRFGLFFHDDKLASINSDEDAWHVIDCLQSDNLGGEHWSILGLAGYAPWLESRSILGDRQALAAHGEVSVYVHDTPADRARRERGAPTADEVMSMIVYAPLLIAIAPYYLVHGNSADAETVKTGRALETFQESLKLGQAAPAANPYAADANYIAGEIEIRQYKGDSFAYGVRDGKIVMLERPAAMDQDDGNEEWRRKHRRADCAVIREKR